VSGRLWPLAAAGTDIVLTTRISAADTGVITRPARPPAWATATTRIAGRALRKYLRTPGLLIVGIVQSAMFLFVFRYVFGGAIHVGAGGYTPAT
jgi:ABC-2 type transport system permease protein